MALRHGELWPYANVRDASVVVFVLVAFTAPVALLALAILFAYVIRKRPTALRRWLALEE